MMSNDGPHITHCCVKHVCKYGEDDICPVTTRRAKQAYLCELCEEESESAQKLGFKIVLRSGSAVLVYTDQYRRPANTEEVKLWVFIHGEVTEEIELQPWP